ncbi:MAG: ABC transporter substrate-binding protein [Pseudomonadota bacterium]
MTTSFSYGAAVKTLTIAGAALGLALGTVAAHAESIKVGMLVTLSGPPGALGGQSRDGFQLALEELGGKMGGQDVEFIVEDDELKPEVALSKANSLIERDSVDFVVGTIFSNMLAAVFKPVTQSETFLISPNAGPSTFAGKNCNPYFFVTSYQNNQNFETLGKYAEAAGIKKAFFLAPNYQAGRDQAEGFRKHFTGEVVEELYTPLGHKDFSAEIAQMAASDAEALFTFMPGGMGVRLVKQFRAAGLADRMKFYSAFTVDETTLPAQQDDAVGFFGATNWAPNLDTPQNKAFVAAFEAKYGYVPGGYAMQGYDTAMLINAAVEAVGGDLSDKDAVRAALKAADFTSLRGDFSFNNNHYPVQDFYLLQVAKRDDGKYQTEIVEKVFDDYADGFAESCPM